MATTQTFDSPEDNCTSAGAANVISLKNRRSRRDLNRLRLVGTTPRAQRHELLSDDLNFDHARDASILSQALLLDVMGQAPVSFHRAYVDVTGNVLTALWLSFAIARMTQAEMSGQKAVDESGDFVFSASEVEIEQETGLTAAQQRQSRRALKHLGLISGITRSPAQVLAYRLSVAKLIDRLLATAQDTAQALRQQDQERAANESPSLEALRNQMPAPAWVHR